MERHGYGPVLKEIKKCTSSDKHEDLSSDPRIDVTKLNMVSNTCNPSAWGGDYRKKNCISMAIKSSYLVSF